MTVGSKRLDSNAVLAYAECYADGTRRSVQVDDEGRLVLAPGATSLREILRRQIVRQPTIANGAAISDEIDLDGCAFGGIIFPDGWTAAVLTFIVVDPTGTLADRPLYDDSGTEISMTVAAIRAVPLPVEVMWAGRIKLRSGTVGAPVNQGALREFVINLKG